MSTELIEKLAKEHGAVHYSPPPTRAVKGLSFTFEQLEAFAKAYADNQEMYLLKVLADIRQAMGNADKLILDELAPAIAKACALQSSEPVAEALHERNRLGYELQDALEEMPQRAELYTSPISKEWVGLSEVDAIKIYKEADKHITDETYALNLMYEAELKLKQLNVPEKG